MKFKYKLEGFDKNWVDAGSRREAAYTNIPPGNYTFKVMGCNNDGVWNEAGASIGFYVKPHFHQTYWFYGLCIIAAAIVGLGIYRIRVKQIQAQFSAVLAERNRIARDIHDTLSQSFVGISLQLEVVKAKLFESPRAAENHLDLASSLVHSSLFEARQSIWDLRSDLSTERDLATTLFDKPFPGSRV